MSLVPANPALLEENLQILSLRSPQAVERIRACVDPGDPQARFELAPDGGVCGVWRGRQLASMRAPIAEGARLAESVDVLASATVVVRGLGLGHHITPLAKRLGQRSCLIVFEPDLALLKAVLSRVDLRPAMLCTTFLLATSDEDRGELTQLISTNEAMIASGVGIVDHPASKARLAGASERFGALLATIVRGVRMHVVTTLVQMETTIRNLLGNLPFFLERPGVADLKDCCKGVPAVVVSAGPSLRRTIDQLAQPGVRDRVVIIAVQTVLKTLLAKGIRPHFVCALDYAEISTRFYEGLTRKDVEGVTLVVEPKANPAILRAFPGAIRCVQDPMLGKMLSAADTRDRGTLPLGATVAHLAYYLARYLGCDPVLLIGQDLGFTDGQYYAPGAAIHTVWSGELSEFCTLEMLEWQRIMRMRAQCRKVEGHDGVPIYTDEQMGSYLLQFERDFAGDAAKGLTTIDATQGGVKKQHTKVMAFAEALEKFAGRSRVTLPTTPMVDPAFGRERGAILKRVAAQLELLRQQAVQYGECCRQTEEKLEKMIAASDAGDARRVDALVVEAQKIAERAVALEAQWLVQLMNQTGQLNRFKRDRQLELSTHLSPEERQRGQMRRDQVNMQWLRESAKLVVTLMESAGETLRTGAPMPKPPLVDEQQALDGEAIVRERPRILGHLHASLRVGGEAARLLREALPRTLARLDACVAKGGASAGPQTLDGLLLTTDDAAALRDVLLPHVDPLLMQCVEIVELTNAQRARWEHRARSVRNARAWSGHCWRSGIANACVYDELLEPGVLCEVLDRAHGGHSCDAVALCGADWVGVDPVLVRSACARHREAPQRLPMVLTQAPAGLAACVVSRGLLGELTQAQGTTAMLGHLLGYHPANPQMDLIAKQACVAVQPVVRDLLLRCAWRDPTFRQAWARGGCDAMRDADAPSLAAALGGAMTSLAREDVLLPRLLEVDLAGVALHDAGRVVAGIATRAAALGSAHGVALTLRDDAGRGAWREVADACRSLAGIAAVHVRLSHRALVREGEAPLVQAMDLGLAAVSVDLPGDAAEVWNARAGEGFAGTLDACWDALQAALDARRTRTPAGLLPTTWLVPRLTRCDATLADIESFYDRWMLTCGACVIDPDRDAPSDARIQPLPVPAHVAAWRAWASDVWRAGEVLRVGAGVGASA